MQNVPDHATHTAAVRSLIQGEVQRVRGEAGAQEERERESVAQALRAGRAQSRQALEDMRASREEVHKRLSLERQRVAMATASDRQQQHTASPREPPDRCIVAKRQAPRLNPLKDAELRRGQGQRGASLTSSSGAGIMQTSSRRQHAPSLNVVACNITALNMRSAAARNVTARNVTARNVAARNVAARNVITSNVPARNVIASNVPAHNVITNNMALHSVAGRNVAAHNASNRSAADSVFSALHLDRSVLNATRGGATRSEVTRIGAPFLGAGPRPRFGSFVDDHVGYQGSPILNPGYQGNVNDSRTGEDPPTRGRPPGGAAPPGETTGTAPRSRWGGVLPTEERGAAQRGETTSTAAQRGETTSTAAQRGETTGTAAQRGETTGTAPRSRWGGVQPTEGRRVAQRRETTATTAQRGETTGTAAQPGEATGAAARSRWRGALAKRGDAGQQGETTNRSPRTRWGGVLGSGTLGIAQPPPQTFSPPPHHIPVHSHQPLPPPNRAWEQPHPRVSTTRNPSASSSQENSRNGEAPWTHPAPLQRVEIDPVRWDDLPPPRGNVPPLRADDGAPRGRFETAARRQSLSRRTRLSESRSGIRTPAATPLPPPAPPEQSQDAQPDPQPSPPTEERLDEATDTELESQEEEVKEEEAAEERLDEATDTELESQEEEVKEEEVAEERLDEATDTELEAQEEEVKEEEAAEERLDEATDTELESQEEEVKEEEAAEEEVKEEEAAEERLDEATDTELESQEEEAAAPEPVGSSSEVQVPEEEESEGEAQGEAMADEETETEEEAEGEDQTQDGGVVEVAEESENGPPELPPSQSAQDVSETDQSMDSEAAEAIVLASAAASESEDADESQDEEVLQCHNLNDHDVEEEGVRPQAEGENTDVKMAFQPEGPSSSQDEENVEEEADEGQRDGGDEQEEGNAEGEQDAEAGGGEEEAKVEEAIQEEENISETSQLRKNIKEAMESELECVICNELLVNATTIECSHTFCALCLERWQAQKKWCPICRNPISKTVQAAVVDNLINKMTALLGPEATQARDELVAKRQEEMRELSEEWKERGSGLYPRLSAPAEADSELDASSNYFARTAVAIGPFFSRPSMVIITDPSVQLSEETDEEDSLNTNESELFASRALMSPSNDMRLILGFGREGFGDEEEEEDEEDDEEELAETVEPVFLQSLAAARERHEQMLRSLIQIRRVMAPSPSPSPPSSPDPALESLDCVPTPSPSSSFL